MIFLYFYALFMQYLRKSMTKVITTKIDLRGVAKPYLSATGMEGLFPILWSKSE